MGLYKVLIVVGALVAILGYAIALFGVADKDGIDRKKALSLIVGLMLVMYGCLLIGFCAALVS